MTSVLGPERVGSSDEDSPRVAREFLGALKRLSEQGRDQALRRLMAVIAQQDRVDDGAVVVHFLRSLLMTARMERDPAYLVASTQRDVPGEPREVADVIAEIEARCGDRGA